MPSRTLPNLALEAFFLLGEDGWDDEVNLNFLKLSVLTQAGAISKVAATPGSPAAGDVHIFSETHPTQPNMVAVFDGGVWKYFTPLEGWLIYNRGTNTFELFDGAVWTPFSGGSVAYSLPFGFTSAPVNAEVLLIHVFAENVLLPDNFTGARGHVGINPTATATLTVQKNGADVGTISISTTGVVTFNTTGTTVSFVPGDRMNVLAQSVADATLANCAFTFRGTRS